MSSLFPGSSEDWSPDQLLFSSWLARYDDIQCEMMDEDRPSWEVLCNDYELDKHLEYIAKKREEQKHKNKFSGQ